MKKISFIAVALATVLLVGCQPDPEPTVNSVTLDKTKLTLAVGAEEMLKATVDPAGTAVAWASSDNAVAIVTGGGMVSAVAEGTAVITATAGEKTAECVVTVEADAFYNELSIAESGVYIPAEDVIPGTDTVLTLGLGETKCALAYIPKFFAWDENVTFDEKNSAFVGNGIVFVLQNIPMYVVNDEKIPDYAGVVVNMGYFGVVPSTEGEVLPLFANSGNIEAETYGDWIQLLYSTEEDLAGMNDSDIEAIYTKAMANTTGALMLFGEDEGYDAYTGAINKLLYQSAFQNPETGEEYPEVFAADVTWANVTAEDRCYGFKVDMDVLENEQKIKLVTPYDYSKIDRVFDVNGVFDAPEEAPAKVSARTPKLMNSSYRLEKTPTFNGKSLDNKTLHMAK